MNKPNSFKDDAAVAALVIRVPAAQVGTGMDFGSNQCGVGIATDNAGLDESLPSWTLLDQGEFANDFVPRIRVNQRSQCIGGPGISAAGTSDGQEGSLPAAVASLFINPINIEGQPNPVGIPTVEGGAALADLALGWAVGA
jgi:hypothetical protein